jgi:hypothetical protein
MNEVAKEKLSSICSCKQLFSYIYNKGLQCKSQLLNNGIKSKHVKAFRGIRLKHKMYEAKDVVSPWKVGYVFRYS